jgi:hypothetical protein
VIEQIAARSKAGEKVSLITVQSISNAKAAMLHTTIVRPAEETARRLTIARIATTTAAPPDVISVTPVFQPAIVDPPRPYTINEALLRLQSDNRLKAKQLINDLEEFGFAANPDKLEAIAREAAFAQITRDAAPIRRVVEAILAGLDHPKDHGGDIIAGLDSPKLH